MKFRTLLVWAALLPAMVPVLAHAEIYKWKDKDGSIRYSDIPPPSNVKNEAIGRKVLKTPATAEAGVASAVSKDAATAPKDAAPLSKEEAAAKRARDVEAQKKADAVKQAELKFRQESCELAKKNLAMFNNGGRIMATDEKGERHYYDDAEIAQGKVNAQRDVEKFCS